MCISSLFDLKGLLDITTVVNKSSPYFEQLLHDMTPSDLVGNGSCQHYEVRGYYFLKLFLFVCRAVCLSDCEIVLILVCLSLVCTISV